MEEAADRLTRPTTVGALRDKYVDICKGLLTDLTPLEPYQLLQPGSLEDRFPSSAADANFF